ncbi:MAG: universal stress protein [Nitrospirota bacterium]|jgi:nucleotide-binding universal stress UspA family protein
MGRYRRVLVAFDGSRSSRNALKQAIVLARAEKSWVKVATVMPSYEGDLELVGVSNIGDVLRGPAERLIGEAQALADAEEYPILTNVQRGEPYERILDVAKEENCDLIVMGRRGMHRIERMLMGSVTARVVAHAPVDVLAIPRDAALGWQRILVATDGSLHSQAALEHAVDFGLSHGSALTVLSAAVMNDELHAQAPDLAEKLIEKARSAAEAASRKAGEAGLRAEALVKEGDAHQCIIEAAGEKKADVIFMGSHGRSGVKKLLMGSVTEKVIGLSGIPVLVTRLSGQA